MTVIRSQAEIANATMEDLVETYEELTGKRITGFASRDLAETKVANAILSAQNKAGHLGVPKGTTPRTLTKAERDEIAQEKGISSEPDEHGAPGKPDEKQEPPRAPRTRTKRTPPSKVKATNSGTSKLQPESSRAQVLAWIKAQPDQTATYDQLEAQFKEEARAVFKLMEKGHLEAV